MLNNAEDVKNCTVTLIKSAADYLKRTLPESAELNTALESLGGAEYAVEVAVDAAVKAQEVSAEIKVEPTPVPAQDVAVTTTLENTEQTDADVIARIKANPELLLRAMRQTHPKAWSEMQNALISMQ